MVLRSVVCRLAFVVVVSAWLCAPAVAQAHAAVSQVAARDFEIPPQLLASALHAFARQSGLEVLIEADVAADTPCAGVAGRMPPLAALGVLLDGTGLGYAMSSPTSVHVFVAAPHRSTATERWGFWSPFRLGGGNASHLHRARCVTDN